MLILDEHNHILDSDKIDASCYYSVLRFRDPKNPDFCFEELTYIEEFSAPTMKIEIGSHTLFVPFHWSILCSDQEYVQTIPLYEFAGRAFTAFCINPIDGYLPTYAPIRLIEVFTNTTWSAPPIHDKDMLVVPVGPPRIANGVAKGPMCAILSPHKLDISRSIADIL